MKFDNYFLEAKKQGIKELELSLSKEYSLSFSFFRGEVESYSTSNVSTLSARGTYNNRAGYVNTEVIDRSTLNYIIEKIKENASVNNSSDEVIIFKGSEKYQKKNVYNPKLSRISIEEKMSLIKELENRIKKSDKRITDIELGYSESTNEYNLMNSYGLNLKSKSNYCSIYAQVVAVGSDSETKTGFKVFTDNDLDKFDIDEFVDKVVDATISQLNGGPCLSKKYKAVLNPDVTASLINFFISNAIADEVQKNTSLFKGKLNQLVASKKVTIEERPLDKNPFFRYFDDEGVATYNKKIVKNGRLETYLYNLATAKKDGVESTGNGYRGSGKVSTSTTNIVLKPGNKTEAELFALVQEGIYITDVEGLHAGMNSQSGNFSLQAKGYLIENGRRAAPVCLITVAGNLFKLFKEIKEVGNNSERIGETTASSVYIKELAVSGI